MGIEHYGQPTSPLNAPRLSDWAASVYTTLTDLQSTTSEHVADPDPHPQYASRWGEVSSWAALPASGEYAGQAILVNDPPNVGLLVARWTGTAWVVDPVSDTGWRDVSGSLINGWTGTLQVRRCGPRVFWVLSNLAGGTGSAYTIPVGFRSARISNNVNLAANSATAVGSVRLSNTVLQPYGAAIAYSGAWLDVSAAAEAAWPTTLPGTAV